MSSAFNPFPVNTAPAPHKTVDYGTGVVVTEDGAIVTDRQITDGCLAITIPPFGNADRLAEDKDHDLALLHIYGARGLTPLSLASNRADKANVEIVSGGGELPDEILPRDIKHDDSMLHRVTLTKFNAYFLKQVLPPRNEDNVDS